MGFFDGGAKAAAEAKQQALMQDMKGELAAIDKSMGTIEFSLDGKILKANDNFLRLLGYTLEEIKGQHHRIFVDPAYRESAEYREFWAKLARGEFDAAQYKRIGKGGKEVWIQASYNPIMDGHGKPYKVVKFASDITEQKMQNANFEGQLAAINKSMATIEFSLEGLVLTANDNFLKLLSYSLDEVKGKHHRIFVDPAYRETAEYREFWAKLGRGEYDAGQYKRIGKGGKEVWIQASYNPIMDANGKPYKVVKFAIDVTAQVKATQALNQAVEETQVVVAAAKEGDLTQRIPMEGKTGALESLCEGINSLVQSMLDVLLTIKESSDTISTASQEIAAGNSDLSQRTEEQASSLEETAASMEELTSTVRQNAENAKQANQLAISSSTVATKGGEVVRDSVSTMAQISESSKKIADIISVIDGIAFQTNILALNAAVEAARAGEQGRGFAVVAAEVRNLAQRSANAAKEIKTLITDSVSKVESGTAQVTQAGKTMDEIVESIKRVTDIMAEITAASNEQSQGIEQVNKAITQMDEVTQQNAALVEEAAAAAESMEEQAQTMKEVVGRFNLGEEVAPVTRQAAPAKAIATAKRPAPAIARTPAQELATKAKPKTLPKKANKASEEWEEF
jgi:methyl-accepting chemotaxis protein